MKASGLLYFVCVWLLLHSVLNAENSVSVVCPVSKPAVDGQPITIQIRITNDVTLSALSLGFSYNSNDVEITSVSFAGSVATGGMPLQRFVPELNQVLIGWVGVPFGSIAPQSNGLFATLTMQVPLGTPAQSVNIDSSFVGPNGEFRFDPQGGGVIYPLYYDCGTEDIMIGSQTNTAPVVSDIPNQTINSGQSFATISLDNYVTDAESPDNQIVWTATSSNPNGLSVNINSSGIATVSYPGGTFEGSATFSFRATDPGSLFDTDDATFTVARPPHIVLTPTSLAFEAVQGGALPPAQSFTISNSGGGTLSWSVVENSTEFDVSPLQGTSNLQQVTVWINSTALPPDTYMGIVVVNSSNGDNSGQTVSITYEVAPPSGIIHLVYGPDENLAGVPVNGACAKLYRDDQLIQEAGPTGASGDLTFASLLPGDEVYAYKIIGAGRTLKALHPSIPDNLMPDPNPYPNEICDEPLPWRALYFNYLDNQFVDGTDILRKWIFDGTTNSIQLNHRIAKLDLVLGFDHAIVASDYQGILNQVRGKLDNFNSFFLNATNGLVAVNSVLVHSDQDFLSSSDVLIKRVTTPNMGDSYQREDLKYPSFWERGHKTFFDRNQDFASLQFDRFLAHEIGHYFLNLGEEYSDNNSALYCNGGYANFHSSIMSNNLRSEVEEYCDANHDPGQLISNMQSQNFLHSGRSCWLYLEGDWNNFENAIPSGVTPCKEFLLHDQQFSEDGYIRWERPSTSVNYVRGPYFESAGHTSQGIVINNQLFASIGGKNIPIQLHTDAKGAIVGIVTSEFKRWSGTQDIQSFEQMGFIDPASMSKPFTIYSVEPDERIWVVAEGCKPVIISPDTVSSDLNFGIPTLKEDSTFISSLSASFEAATNEVTITVHTSVSLSGAPTLSFFQNNLHVSTFQMALLDDSTFSVTIVVSDSISMSGSFIISHNSMPEVFVSSWEMTAFASWPHFFSNYTIVADSSIVADSIELFVMTCPVPKGANDYASDRTFPSGPLFITSSPAIPAGDSLDIGIFAGRKYLYDTATVIVRCDYDGGNIEELQTSQSEQNYCAYARIGSEGLYMLSGKAAWECGDANGSGAISISDVVYLINYIFSGGPAPNPVFSADANCSGGVNISDAVYLINYIFTGGAAPCASCQ